MTDADREGNGAEARADELDLELADEQVDALTREEVLRRAEAPLPRSLLDFLR